MGHWQVRTEGLLSVLEQRIESYSCHLVGVLRSEGPWEFGIDLTEGASGSFCLKMEVEESDPSPDHLTSRHACVAGGIISRASSLLRAAGENLETYPSSYYSRAKQGGVALYASCYTGYPACCEQNKFSFIEINLMESFEWPNKPYPERANLGWLLSSINLRNKAHLLCLHKFIQTSVRYKRMSFGYLCVRSSFEFSQTQWMFYSFYKIKNLIQEKKRWRKANSRQTWTWLIDTFAFPEISTKQMTYFPSLQADIQKMVCFLFFVSEAIDKQWVTSKYLKVYALKIGTKEQKKPKFKSWKPAWL